jgi:hypothetical protein
MPAGTYYFADFAISGSSILNVTGPATIYVTGTFDVSGTVATASNLPANLKVRISSSSNAKLSGGGTYYMDLYAPNAPVLLSGGSELYGSVVGASLTDSGDAIHYDQSLGGGSGSSVTIVR